MVLCMQEKSFKYYFICIFIHTVIWKEILLTVIASSKHTKTTICSSKYPRLQWKQIRFGYSSSKSPAASHHTIKRTGTPCLAGEGGPEDQIPATFVIIIPTSEVQWLVAAWISSFLQDLRSFVLTSSKHKHALSIGLQLINLLREAFWMPDGTTYTFGVLLFF